MNDLISRQAVIALAKDLCVPIGDGTVYRHRCIDPDAVNELPPVQPEQGDEVNFWKERAREYEDVIIYLSEKLAKGIKFDSIEITGEGIRFKKSQPKQRWVPVTERLPKAFEHCLFTTVSGEVVYRHWDGAVSQYTAWMPLPEPWKGENDVRHKEKGD